jgi:membrane fusion protein, multidrug efflux system
MTFPRRPRIIPGPPFRDTGLVCLVAWMACLMPAAANEGFSEPYRTIHVAAAESGILDEVLVQLGTPVRQGDALVRLDSGVYRAMLAIADAGKQARGRADAAQAEVELRNGRLQALKKVQSAGHARQEEVDRAQADLAIAMGQLASARELQRLKELEYDKIILQIERRTIRAPLNGIVTNIFKQAGEYTAPNDPKLMVIVQLDPLAAMFDIMGEGAKNLAVDDAIQVQFSITGEVADAVIEYISPVMDAESGTIAVKVRIPNPDGKLQSGQACVLMGGNVQANK